MKITIISGGTLKGKATHRVALALEKQLISKGQEVFIIDLMAHKQLNFSGPFSSLHNKLPKLENLSKIVQASNAIIFLTSEYNGSITKSLKNFIDVFDTPIFDGKPIGVAALSRGIFGGSIAAHQLQGIILALKAYPQPQMLQTGEVTKRLNEDGEILDPQFQNELEIFTDAFIRFSNRFLK